MKALLGALVLVVIMSAPALAQRSGSYGYQGPYSYRGPYSNQSPARVIVPRTGPFSNDPAATGGGSLGYNQKLWVW
jgi:hypothetical protein